MIRKGTAVRITWEDIQDASNDDWNADPNDLDVDTATIETLGWIAKDYRGGRKVVIARDLSVDDDTYRSMMAIPAGCVTSITELVSGREVWDRGDPGN